MSTSQDATAPARPSSPAGGRAPREADILDQRVFRPARDGRLSAGLRRAAHERAQVYAATYGVEVEVVEAAGAWLVRIVHHAFGDTRYPAKVLLNLAPMPNMRDPLALADHYVREGLRTVLLSVMRP